MKKFLSAFTAVATSFVNQAVSASENKPEIALLNKLENVVNSYENNIPKLSLVDSKGDEQLFVLKRQADSGYLMAYHESHSSHSSHSSHRSHYSSR